MSVQKVVFLKLVFTWSLGAAEQAEEIEISLPASLWLHVGKNKNLRHAAFLSVVVLPSLD